MLARVVAPITLAALLAAASAASAADVVYSVDRMVGLGSVTGTITTDGATGVLGAGDIVAFDLQLNGPGASFHLTSPNFVDVRGSDLTATAQTLSFNFSGADDGLFLLQQGPFSGMTYYCDATSSADCFQGESVVPASFSDPSAQNVPQVGNQVIGVASVPEPASWALMLLGFSALGLGLRRRSAIA